MTLRPAGTWFNPNGIQNELNPRLDERGRALHNLACVLALSGERERALAAMAGAVDAGFAQRAVYLGDPDFASIRDDPRFLEILGRLVG